MSARFPKSGYEISRLTALVVASIGCVVLAASAPAQPASAPPAAAQENRYLLIVDTSTALRERALGSLTALTELMATGMQGQIHEGDTIAMWTFDDDLYAGRFPIQHWAAANQTAILTSVLTFLRDQNVGKASKLEKVLPAMRYVIQSSELLTIFLVIGGERKITGTPFDNQINDYCARVEKEQRKAKMPVVVVLRSVRGQITEFAVNTPPRPIHVPLVPALTPPAPPAPVQMAKAAAIQAPHPAPDLTKLPPGALVFSGTNAQPVGVPNPAEPPAANTETALRVETAAAVTTESLNASPIVAPDFTLSESSPASRRGPAPAAPRAAQPLNAEVTQSAAVAGATTVPKTEPARTREANEYDASAAAKASAVALRAMADKMADEAPSPYQNEPTPMAGKLSKPAPTTGTKTVPIASAGSAAAAAPAAVAASLHPGELHPAKARPHTHPPATPAHPEAAMVAPVARLADHWTFWAAAVLLGATALGCSWLMVRRSRPAPSASLITFSIDHTKGG